jgi:hypothetical protein
MRFVLCKERQNSHKQVFFCGYIVVEAPTVFEAGWSDCLYFLFLCSFYVLT